MQRIWAVASSVTVSDTNASFQEHARKSKDVFTCPSFAKHSQSSSVTPTICVPMGKPCITESFNGFHETNP